MQRRKRFAGYTAILALLLLLLMSDREPAIVNSLPTPLARPQSSAQELSSMSQPPPQHPPEQSQTEEAPSGPPGHNFSRIQAKMSRDTSRFSSTSHADGTVQINLNGGFQSASMARRKPDGSLEVRCFNQFEGVREFLLSPAAPSPTAQISRVTPPPSAEK